MKKPAIAAIVIALAASAAISIAEDAAESLKMPEMPKPTKEHQWLERFVGEWEGEGEITMEPGQPAVKCKGKEVVKSLGGFWIVSKHDSEMMGHPMEAVLTLGYSAKEKKYVGTWIDSMQDYLWTYKGTVDESGNVLTLDTEGPCPMRPGEIIKFKEVVEFKSDDERVFTSSMYLDGKWITPIKITSRRTK